MEQDIRNALEDVYWKAYNHTHMEGEAIGTAFEQIKECLEEPISKILFISKDKRQRIMLQEEVDWLEEKMKEIRKLAKQLSKGFGYKPKKWLASTE